MPSPPWARSRERSPCTKRIEDARQQLGRNADARIRDDDGEPFPSPLQLDADLPAGIGIFRGIGEDVCHALDQAGVIDAEIKPLEYRADQQLVIPFTQEWLDYLDRIGDDRRDRNGRGPQFDAAFRDSRDVQKIVHDPNEMRHLTLDDRNRPARL